MKIYTLKPGEDWIVDRMVNEWNTYNKDITTLDVNECDVCWLLADWSWRHVESFLWVNQRRPQGQRKKVIVTVHHIVPDKFNTYAQKDFNQRDVYVDVYHVFNEIALEQVKKLTKKEVVLIPYWCNQNIWKQTSTKEELRVKHNIPEDAYVVGSFQRDTEGAGLTRGFALPKLEKGPDLLSAFLQEVSYKEKSLHVVLAGWRRQYIIGELQNANIKYSFFEKPEQPIVNELYQTLDLYPITARHEGGPQSLLECGLTAVPVVSRNVGIASQVLQKESINDNVFNAVPSIPNVESMKIPHAFEKYREFFKTL